ncbi:DWNN-domain-containing protein [Schizophyllum commune Tattone D]|nr:DWNN-domain-containing protein [Schizophyllum commune Tattone D]
MASSVFYRFASRKDESRVTFDGTGISIFDLKREIILANNMSKANDFDLYVFNPATQEEYADDTTIIPRSSSVIVKRRPAARPGKGKAAYYTAGVGGNLPVSEPNQRGGGGGGGSTWYKGAMSKRFDGKDEGPKANSTPNPAPAMPPSIPGATDDEEAAIAAMFQTQTANWEEAQEKLSHAAHVPLRGTGFAGRGKLRTPYAAPERPLPASYVCYRCGQKGHWIKDCPTNNDRDYDNRPRIKRTTGIPRSFLKAVENPDGATLGQGVMVTPEGGYVVAQPDLASWQKQVQRPKGLTEAEVRERPPSDESLSCPIDNKLFRDAVKTPCCGTSYCEECIQTHLLERDFICPSCGKKIPSLDKLLVDKPARTRVWDYIERTIEESKKGEGEEGDENHEEGEQAQVDPGSLTGSELEQMVQMLSQNIPQLQAQITQVSQALQNPNLPPQVRQTAEMQQQQLQMELAQAQTLGALAQQAQAQNMAMAAAYGASGFVGGGGSGFVGNGQSGFTGNGGASGFVGNGGPSGFVGNGGMMGGQSGWVGGNGGQFNNNNKRPLKRDRPSDFTEVAGQADSKQARY